MIKKIVFVCHGNICRSPMAEMIMKDIVAREGAQDKFIIESRALHTDAIGMPIYGRAKATLEEHGVPIDGAKRATLLTRGDYKKYDFIIGMDDMNSDDMLRLFGGDIERKVFLLLDFTDNPRDVADPWYTRDFEKTYRDIVEGAEALYKYIIG